ncbi:hypothetical protein X882_5892 [Burkholderia pseudomallei MSHR4303]|nr:hypothetical protein X882_5892 [Burkholderia pseudomallei MSHR4303]
MQKFLHECIKNTSSQENAFCWVSTLRQINSSLQRSLLKRNMPAYIWKRIEGCRQ